MPKSPAADGSQGATRPIEPTTPRLRISRKFAEAHGWEVGAEFEDAYTGTVDDRPVWNNLEEAAHRGEFDVVVLAKWNRLASKTSAGLAMIERLEEQLGVRIAVAEMDIDTTTNAGRYMRTQMLAFAEMQHDDLVSQMALGAYAKARDGRWPSSGRAAPFGFRVEGVKRDARLVLDDRESATANRAAYLLVDEDWDLADTCWLLNNEGLVPRTAPAWATPNLRFVMSKRSLIGEVTWARPTTAPAASTASPSSSRACRRR